MQSAFKYSFEGSNLWSWLLTQRFARVSSTIQSYGTIWNWSLGAKYITTLRMILTNDLGRFLLFLWTAYPCHYFKQEHKQE